jgi:hypothetical protein
MLRERQKITFDKSIRKGVFGYITWTVVAEVANEVDVSGQAYDEAGNEMAEACAFSWYFSSDAAGLDPLTTAHDGGTAIDVDGALIEQVANLSGIAITEADGDISLTVTDAGAFTSYLVGVNPDGSLSVSAVLTHTA